MTKLQLKFKLEELATSVDSLRMLDGVKYNCALHAYLNTAFSALSFATSYAEQYDEERI